MEVSTWPEWLLYLLSALFYVFHTLFILFNVLGWMYKPTQRLHLYAVGITLFSWGVLGFWKGFGYCFLTDWHYDLLRALGHTDLPSNYLAFLARQLTGWLPSEILMNWSIGIGMTVATLGSIYVNFFKRAH
ncbi:DUF2784 family protein [Croceiramulus getboli]|nr:DUF2784 family protein [Flavobacteriaceae bacterium YJPT1-3]